MIAQTLTKPKVKVWVRVTMIARRAIIVLTMIVKPLTFGLGKGNNCCALHNHDKNNFKRFLSMQSCYTTPSIMLEQHCVHMLQSIIESRML